MSVAERPLDAVCSRRCLPRGLATVLRPEFGALAGLVLIGTAFVANWALRVPGWNVMTDELLYVKLARQIGDSLFLVPAVHGQFYSQLTPMYPLALAPAYGWLPTPAAFAVAHGLNALFMANAAIPTYLLAREIRTPRTGAYIAAALTVAAPWSVYSFFLMTEALAYPVFLWTVLACAQAVARPSWRRDLVALAAIAVAILTRTQFAVFALILPGAVLVHEFGQALAEGGPDPLRSRIVARAGRVLREHVLLAASAVVAIVAVAGLSLTGGVGRATGNYSVLFSGDPIPSGTLSAVRPHLVLLVVGAGVVSFLTALAWVLDALAEPRRRTDHALASVAVLTGPAVLLVNAAFDRRELGALVQDRYGFYLVPLFFVGMAAYLFGTRRRRVSLVLSALATVWVLASFNTASIHAYSYVVSPQTWFKNWVAKVLGGLGAHGLGVGFALSAATLVVTALLVWAGSGRRARSLAIVLSVGTLALCVVQSVYNLDRVLAVARSQLVSYGIGHNNSRDWVDRLLPDSATAAIVPGIVDDLMRSRGAWWDVEFWNSSITEQYDYAPAFDATPFRDRDLRLDWRSGMLGVDGPAVDYLVLPEGDRRFQPRGATVARRDGLVLVRPSRPLRAVWSVRGTNEDGWTLAGRPATIRVFPGSPPRGAAVVVQLTSTKDVTGGRSYRLSGGERPRTGSLEPGHQVEVPVAMCLRGDRPTDVTVAVQGSSTLLSGVKVGLAITGVRIVPRGGCART